MVDLTDAQTALNDATNVWMAIGVIMCWGAVLLAAAYDLLRRALFLPPKAEPHTAEKLHQSAAARCDRSIR